MINSFFVSSNYKDFNIEGTIKNKTSKESSRLNDVTSMEVISGKKLALTKIVHLASQFANHLENKGMGRSFSQSFTSECYSPNSLRLPEKFQKAFLTNYALKGQNSCLPVLKSNLSIPLQSIPKEPRGELGQKAAEAALTSNKSVIEECLAQLNGPDESTQALKKQLQEIQTQVNELSEKGTPFTPKDFLDAWTLSLRTAHAVCRMGLPAAETLAFIQKLETENNAKSWKKIFAQERLDEMLSIVQGIKDSLSEEDFSSFEEFSKDLEAIQADATYDDSQIEDILEKTYELTDLINGSKLSRNDKIKFNRRLGDLFEYQVELMKIIQQLEEVEISIEKQTFTTFEKAISLVEALLGIFAPINLSSNLNTFSAIEASTALQTLININSLCSDLSDEQIKLVDQALKTLSKLEAFFGATWAYFLASVALTTNPTGSIDDIGQLILQELAKSEHYGLELVELARGTAGLIVKNKGWVNIPRYYEDSIMTVVYEEKRDKLVESQRSKRSTEASVELNYQLMNKNGDDSFIGGFAKEAGKFQLGMISGYNAFAGSAAASQQESADDLAVLEKQLQALKALETTSKQENSQIKIGELKSLALPSSVAFVLIDSYMPKEVDFLENLYKQLYYSNLGSAIGNAVLDAISGYLNSGTFFNFASFVGQQPVVGVTEKDVYPGTKESAQNRLDSEKEAAMRYSKQTEEGLKVIAEQMELVNNDPKISQEERMYLMSLLTEYANSLRAIALNLTAILAFLSQITVTDYTGKDEQSKSIGVFKVEAPNDWRENLQSLEEGVVSGLIGKGAAGGMFNVQAKIQSDQQSFADMGQTYQLNLQMHLTSMQQEWTIVATSLQVLNQIYLGLARSLLR